MSPAADTLVFVALGAVFGFFGGLFGIGGGIVAIPILGIGFGMSEQAAQGTALVMVVPNAVVGLWRYLSAVKLDWRIVGGVTVTAFPMTLVASRVATLLPSRTLRLAFAIFTIFLAIYIAWRTSTRTRVTRTPLAWPYAAVLGGVTGVISGFFTIGGAIFAVPALTELFGLSQIAAQATALAFVTPGVFLSLGVYAFASDITWPIGIPLAFGGVFAVPLGVELAKRLPDRILRYAFVGFLCVCSIGLFARARTG